MSGHNSKKILITGQIATLANHFKNGYSNIMIHSTPTNIRLIL